ncbi:MAG TPA: hypothetical protein VGF29_14760 [Hyphomicrobiaceae bacterium]|jgi:hypothetical protein
MSALAAKKKEAFAAAVAAGATFADAYRQTRDCAKMQASTVRANAKKLAREPAVKERIKELRESNQKAGRESQQRRESPGPAKPSGASNDQENLTKGDASQAAPPPDSKAEELRRESKAKDFSRSIARARAREGGESSSPAEPSGAPMPAPEEPKPRGRPTIYTEEIAAVIVTRLAAGEPLRTICRNDRMPDESTVRGWALDPDHPFAKRYALAREMGFFSMADELLEIADDARNDFMERMTRSGEVETVVNEEVLARSRMRIATRQWLLAKALPQTFGDRLEQNLKVEDITPRPQDPGREAMRAAIKRVREAAIEYEKRTEADRAAKALPATSHNGKGATEH